MNSYCLWFFGMPNAGKSTLAYHLLQDRLRNVVVIDGDQYRQHLSPVGFQFDRKDILTNNESAARLAKFLMSQGFNVIVAMITPYNEGRKIIKDILGDKVTMIWVDAPAEVRRSRPNHRESQIQFEEPSDCDMRLNTQSAIESCMSKIYARIREIKASPKIDITAPIHSVTLVTTGRTGSDFLQSLFDSHPNVLTFNGWMPFHKFWRNSKCVAKGAFNPSDLIDEFIGTYIDQLQSRYDVQENKDRMGESRAESISIDTLLFKSTFLALLGENPATSRNVMVAIYYAYAKCLDQDLTAKTLLFHHLHHHEELPFYLSDFPDSKLIVTVFDPRANFHSGITQWREYSEKHDNETHLYAYIKRILDTSRQSFFLDTYGVEPYSVKLETMEGEIQSLCRWLGLPDHPALTRSTFGGLRWWSDRLCPDMSKELGYDKSLVSNDWQKRLGPFDKYVIHYLTQDFIRRCGYRPYRKTNHLDTLAAGFILWLPLSYELRFISPKYLWKHRRNLRLLLRNALYYIKRVLLFYRHYLKARSLKARRG